jgi:hypothetical protein
MTGNQEVSLSWRELSFLFTEMGECLADWAILLPKQKLALMLLAFC